MKIKFAKKALSLLLVVAVLAASMLTLTVSASTIDLSQHGTVVAWGSDTGACDTEEEFLAGVTGTGTEEDPYIIDTPEEFVYIVNYASTTSAGKFYKVADGISAFNMGCYAEDATAEEIKANLSDWNSYYFNADQTSFQGTFDGNGVVFYGVHNSSYHAGLFPKVSGTEVTIKNVTVASSYFNATGDAAGGLIGNVSATTVNIENCAVVNCYINGGTNVTRGSLAAQTGGTTTANINNCYIAGNLFDRADGDAQPIGGVIGSAYKYGNSITNIVALESPFTYHPQGLNCAINDPDAGANTWSNIYVSMDPLDLEEVVAYDTSMNNPYRDFTEIATNVTDWTDASQLTGLTDAWVVTTTGPVLASAHNFDIVKGDATHAMTCVCGLTTGEVEHTFVDGTCVCGATCTHANTTPVAEVPADCENNGVAAHDKCDVCGKLFVEGVEKTAEELVILAGHKLTAVAEDPADCQGTGTAAHDKCDVCGKLFVDGAEKTLEELEIPVAAHNLTYVDAYVAADCSEDNVAAHYKCEVCEKLFADEAGENEITLADITTPSAHNLEAVDAAPAVDCTATGVAAHFKCADCERLFADEAGENEVTLADLETPAADHELKAVPEVPAQPGETGTLAHDKCEVCGRQFIDGVEKTLEELEIPALPVAPAYTEGWVLGSAGWWYQYEDGTYATGWASICGTWYYFDVNGWMQTGWVAAGNWYYMDASGAMVTGWASIGGDWYYFDASGAMVTGWLYAGGDWYYFDAAGAMVTGWVYAGGNWYYFNASGTMATGWVYVGSNWYYMDASGAMVTGWVLDGALWYWLDASGVWTGYTEAA